MLPATGSSHRQVRVGSGGRGNALAGNIMSAGGVIAGKEKIMSKEVELGVFAKRFTGRVCVVRTFSAGVHMGRVDYIDPQNKKECILVDCTRIWSWDGSLSLSGVAAKGVKSARLQRCPEIDLTEAIEYLPTTEEALQTFKEEYYT